MPRSRPKDHVNSGKMRITKVDTKVNLADALTKALKVDRVRELTALIRRSRVYGGRALSALRAVIARARGMEG